MENKMNELTIHVDAHSSIPMYEQIYEYIKTEIKEGKLATKSKLPSTRSLAGYLQVSRTTIDLAYMQLVSEGYIESVPAKGYYVAKLTGLYDLPLHKQKPAVVTVQKKEKSGIDFSPRGVDLTHFPYSAWRKLSKEILNVENGSLFHHGNPQGDEALRNTIAAYLFESRGVYCDAEQIVLGAGQEYLLMLLSQILNHKNPAAYKRIAMENPTYPQAYRVLEEAGLEISLVSMDVQGMRADVLNALDVNLAYIMPSHQFPTGVIMPISRRLELLNWAEQSADRYLIEDDYDSEFRYVGKPIPALQGTGNHEKVIYFGTFSKSIAPAIRMAYMILPRELLEIYHEKLGFYASTVSGLDQKLVNAFLAEGYYERHLNKMRAVYKTKHEILLEAIAKAKLPVKIMGERGGLHILLQVENGMTEEAVIEGARENGVIVYPISNYYMDKSEIPPKAIVLLGYAALEETQIQEGIHLLKNVF
jgi:GntR family transcriptional regulator/MocR family aminotransferase